MTVETHGTAAMYSHGRCRCTPCRTAAADAARHRYRMIAYGQWQPFTDATPVREHVRSLQAQGLGWQRIAELAGVAPPTVSSMLYGRSGRPPTGKIRVDTARALLAFQPALADLPPTAPVAADGTVRRLQALAATGWSAQRLAGDLNINKTHVRKIICGKYPRVTAATARAVRGLYDSLWDRPPPEGDRWEKVAAVRTRNHARQQGWPPPCAWNDDEIDNPDAQPVPGWERDGQRETAGDVAELVEFGVPPDAIAARLGVSRWTVQRCLQRARQDQDTAEGDEDAAA